MTSTGEYADTRGPNTTGPYRVNLDKIAGTPLGAVAEAVKGEFGDSVLVQYEFGELTIHSTPEWVHRIIRALRNDSSCQFTALVDVCGIDIPQQQNRLIVVYHLLSPSRNVRVRVKIATAPDVAVPSITDIFSAADWYEREAFDLYGILFSGHPDLRRLLTDYGFEGYPLRKDFPLSGFHEVRYDPEKRQVVQEPVALSQAYREFDSLNPWDDGSNNDKTGD